MTEEEAFKLTHIENNLCTQEDWELGDYQDFYDRDVNFLLDLIHSYLPCWRGKYCATSKSTTSNSINASLIEEETACQARGEKMRETLNSLQGYLASEKFKKDMLESMDASRKTSEEMAAAMKVDPSTLNTPCTI